jgi:hypothetical protein
LPIGALVACAGLALASPALGQSADRQDVEVGFTATRPGASTGDFFRLTVKDPAHPSGKPPRVTRIVSIAPYGSPTDPSALPHCTASDQELMAEGASACPPGSLDATGFAEFESGSGPPADPFTLDLQDFYNGHGLSVVATPRGTPAHLVSHTEFQGPGGEAAVTDFQQMPGGPPDGQTVLRHTELYAPPHGSFFKTPPTCPRSGHWTFRVLVTYADGVTQETDRDSPCVRGRHKHGGNRHAR